MLSSWTMSWTLLTVLTCVTLHYISLMGLLLPLFIHLHFWNKLSDFWPQLFTSFWTSTHNQSITITSKWFYTSIKVNLICPWLKGLHRVPIAASQRTLDKQRVFSHMYLFKLIFTEVNVLHEPCNACIYL